MNEVKKRWADLTSTDRNTLGLIDRTLTDLRITVLSLEDKELADRLFNALYGTCIFVKRLI